VSVLWLLPVNPVGELNRKGPARQPRTQCVTTTGSTRSSGTLRDFKRLPGGGQEGGMAPDRRSRPPTTRRGTAGLITEHRIGSKEDARGNIRPAECDWTDVAGLDYTKPALRRYMIDMMRWLVKDVGIDGFRCDVRRARAERFLGRMRARSSTGSSP